MKGYAELHCLSNFSFRQGASHPGELVRQAAALGYRALAITDTCSMAGMVRAHEAARACELHLIVGAQFHLDDLHLVTLAPDRESYAAICRLITRARRRSEKGRYRLEPADLEEGLAGALVIWKPAGEGDEATARWLRGCFPGRLWIGATRLLEPGERQRFEALDRLGRALDIPRVACGDVRMHIRGRRALLDVLTALEQHTTVAEAGLALAVNGERHLRPPETLERLYPPGWIQQTTRIAGRCSFSMDSLGYRYPEELVPAGRTPAGHLCRLTLKGMRRRFAGQAPERVRGLVARELGIVREMGVEAFFLTVHDVVEFARSRGILCQGRGSAANSAVCYCLGITEVDPSHQQLLFERFISKERNEPPDIDVDFEHERREEVLQYLFDKYGRERAALAATVIHYRPKSALRDVARALGLEPSRINRLTASLAWWDRREDWPERLAACGLDPEAPVTRRFLTLTEQLLGFPRHLSQHVGGMVISQDLLHELVPVENAAMPERTIIQWDKDDLETLGLLKVDCLSLGMLTVIRKAIDYVNQGARHKKKGAGKGAADRIGSPSLEPCRLSLPTIPRDDAATWDMLCAGDAVGVFQVESRAQMAMLPRLRPRCFYDLVIEVAIVRPGPIQGEMVHPYLERRRNPEKVTYPGPELERVLRRTLGVPIFQEQVMQIAIVAAGFSPGEADALRRAMAAWKRRGGLEPFRDKLVSGMRERGYSEEFAERIYRQICGFGDYGFPESHAASFALLTWLSAWLKCHHPAAFAAGLINSQPMGFYAPAQILNDARRHGIKVRPVDVRYSAWDCTLEESADAHPALRLGLRMVSGLKAATGPAISTARAQAPFRDVPDLVERAGLDRGQTRALAEAGALKGLAGHRRQARWEALGTRRQGDLLAGAITREEPARLGLPDRVEEMLADYASLGLSLESHPLRLLRPSLGRRVKSASGLRGMADGSRVQAAGLVTHRQRPGTASGVVFLSLEDETGIVNVIVWPGLVQRYRQAVLEASLIRVTGRLQNAEGVQHLVAETLHDETPRLAELEWTSRDFR